MLALAAAAVLTVGPGGAYDTPCAAIAAARPGATITIDARGHYDGDVCGWTTDRLTIRGVHGRPHIDAAGANSGGKGTWVVGGDHTRIADVELSGAHVPDRNGAAIRAEGTGLTLEHVFLHDNENGVLAGADPKSDIVIERSELARNGFGDGYSHNLYIGAVRSFTLRRSSSHDARSGHLVKSRALRTLIDRDRLRGHRGTGSYELDLPNGGRARVVRTLIEQGPESENPAMVAFGEEGDLHPGSRLTIVRSRLVNDRPAGATAVLRGDGAPRPVVRKTRFRRVPRPR